MSATAADLQKVTGLQEARAKECFSAFGSYAAALASFAQSFSSIPADYFADTQVAHTNAEKINAELREIYRKAREIKAKSGKSDAEVWKMYPAEAAGVAAASASPFKAVAAAFPSSAAAPPSSSATPSPFAAFAKASTPSTTTAQGSVLGEAPKSGSIFGQAANSGSVLGEAPKASFGFGTPLNGAASFGFGTAPPAAATGPKAAPAFGAAAPFAAAANGAAAASPAGAAAPISFGFGTVSPASAPAPAESGSQASAPPPTEPPAAPKKPPTYCEPTHFTGPYFDMPHFWAAEVVERAPLLNLNNGFLEAHKDELRPRMEKWLAKTAFYRKPLQYVKIEDEDEEVVRVIIKDAHRTFFHEEHRAKMVAFLHALYHEFNAYGQAMSYLAGLCMLVMTEDEAAAVIRFVATEYLKGHWAAEAVGFATSAWVVEHFMQKVQPEVAQHLDALKFWPDTYLQKILTGLCIHVLQFNELFDFLDAFMAGGLPYLIRFCLAIVEHFRSQLLAIKTSAEANELYELMRLDSRVADREDVRAILQRAPSIDLGEDGSEIDLIRSAVYEKNIAPRLNRAPKTETFEPCDICDKNRPAWWNDDLGAVCNDCKAAHPDVTFEKF